MEHPTHTPAISVIVPVYNVDLHLPQCLDSLLAQTFADFEILLIDDGSTDGSPAIIARYAHDHPDLIRTFRKPNGGLGDARNYGLERAHGRFVSFVDSDDVVVSSMLAELHACALATRADLVLCGIQSFTESDGTSPYLPEPDPSVFGHSLAEEPRLLYRVDASACDKLYARELFLDSGIRFPVDTAFEDVPTTYRVLARASRVEKVDEPLYQYRRHRPDSISSAYGARYLELVTAFELLNAWYRDEGLFEENREALLRLNLTHLVAGRYSDLMLHADTRDRHAFLYSAFGLLDREFPAFRDSASARELWPHPVLRSVSTRRVLVGLTARLPRRIYLGFLARVGAFDPGR